MAVPASCVEGTRGGFGDREGATEAALRLNTPQYHFLSAAFTPVGAGHCVKQVKWFQGELGISSCFSKTTSSSA